MSLQQQQISGMNIELLITVLSGCNSTEGTKVREELLQLHLMNDGFLTLLIFIIKDPHLQRFNLTLTNTLTIKQSSANLISRIIQLRIKQSSKETMLPLVVALFMEIMPDWDISFNIKKLMLKPFEQSLDLWQTEFEELWENMVEALLNMLLIAKQNPNIPPEELSQEVNSKCLPQPFCAKLTSSTKMEQVYLTLIMIMQAMFSPMARRSAAYQQKLINFLKQLHQLVFNEKFIEKNPITILRLLTFQQQFILTLIDCKEDIMPAALAINNWAQFPNDLQTILFMKAQPFRGVQNCYNFYLLTQHWDQKAQFQMKTLAFDILNEFFTFWNELSIESESSPVVSCIQNISNSVFHSIIWLTQQDRLPQEMQALLQMSLLENFALFIDIFCLDQGQYKTILTKFIIPVMVLEIDNNNVIFQGRNDELVKELENCCELQGDRSRLSYACRLFEIVVNTNEDNLKFIKSYILYSLASKFTNQISQKLQNLSQNAINMPEISLEACFLMMSLLSSSYDNESIENNFLRALLREEAFMQMNANQKKYFYFYMGFAWHFLSQKGDQWDYMLLYSLSEECDIEIQYFAFDFAFNISQDHFCKEFFKEFIQKFIKLHDMETAFQILSKTLNKHFKLLDEGLLCNLVKTLLNRSLKLIKKCVKDQAKGKEGFRPYNIAKYLSICRQISKQHEQLAKMPQLVRTLFSVVSYVQEFNHDKILIDDEAVFIGSQLLSCISKFPEDFEILLQKVTKVFQNSQFSGMAYCYFFGECLQFINKQEYIDRMPNILSMIYDSISEGFAYFTIFPQEWPEDHVQNVGYLAILLQNLFIMFGDKVDEICIVETKNTCIDLINRVRDHTEYVVTSRTQNLILLCQICQHIRYPQQFSKYPLQQILVYVKNFYYCNNRDAIMLIYLLNQIRPAVPMEDQLTLVYIVLYILEVANEFKLSKNLKWKQKFTKSNSIFSYVAQPDPDGMKITQIHQAKDFFINYETDDPNTWNLIIDHIQKSHDSHLLRWIDETKKVKEGQFVNLGMEIPEDSQEEQEDQKEVRQVKNGRRIVKVTGQININSPSPVFPIPQSVKRAIPEAMDQEESKGFEKDGKRRKMESIFNIENKLNKRAKVMEKSNRNTTRI